MNASLRELNSNSSVLARRAQAGETVVITDRGVPIADLVPHQPRVRGVKRADLVRAFRGAGRIDYEAFRSELDEAVDPALDVR